MNQFVKGYYLKVKLLKKTPQKTVWLLKNTLDGELVIAKIQPLPINESKTRGVLHQAKFLQIAQGHQGIPFLHWAGKDDEQGLMLAIIQRLGPTLEEQFQKKGPFSLKTVCMLGIQMIQLVWSYHEKGFVHGNIKLSCFQAGLGKHRNHLFFNDLTHSSSYLKKSKNGKRDMAKYKLELHQFMSLDRMMGYETSRKDDIESVFLLLIFMSKGSLPWTASLETLTKLASLTDELETPSDFKNTSLSKQLTQEDNSKLNRVRARREQQERLIQKIIISIDETPLDDICRGVPLELKQLFEKIQKVEYNAAPDYPAYIRTLRKCLLRHHQEEDGLWDWMDHEDSLALERNQLKRNLRLELPGEKQALDQFYQPFCDKIQLF